MHIVVSGRNKHVLSEQIARLKICWDNMPTKCVGHCVTSVWLALQETSFAWSSSGLNLWSQQKTEMSLNLFLPFKIWTQRWKNSQTMGYTLNLSSVHNRLTSMWVQNLYNSCIGKNYLISWDTVVRKFDLALSAASAAVLAAFSSKYIFSIITTSFLIACILFSTR